MATRKYDSPTRREQAQRTERTVLAAAREILLADGWMGMTMAAVSARAGVSVQLLYKTFGGKAALVKRLYDVTLVGDDEHVPMNARDQIAAIVAEPDPATKIAMYSHLGRTIHERLGAINDRIRAGAAAGDPELAELVATTNAERLVGNRGIVQHLADFDALRTDLAIDHAVDVVWTLTSPELNQLLTTERGWTFDQAEQWVTAQLITSLLAHPEQARTSRAGGRRPRT